jgi:hypothetical protein
MSYTISHERSPYTIFLLQIRNFRCCCLHVIFAIMPFSTNPIYFQSDNLPWGLQSFVWILYTARCVLVLRSDLESLTVTLLTLPKYRREFAHSRLRPTPQELGVQAVYKIMNWPPQFNTNRLVLTPISCISKIKRSFRQKILQNTAMSPLPHTPSKRMTNKLQGQLYITLPGHCIYCIRFRYVTYHRQEPVASHLKTENYFLTVIWNAFLVLCVLKQKGPGPSQSACFMFHTFACDVMPVA